MKKFLKQHRKFCIFLKLKFPEISNTQDFFAYLLKKREDCLPIQATWPHEKLGLSGFLIDSTLPKFDRSERKSEFKFFHTIPNRKAVIFSKKIDAK